MSDGWLKFNPTHIFEEENEEKIAIERFLPGTARSDFEVELSPEEQNELKQAMYAPSITIQDYPEGNVVSKDFNGDKNYHSVVVEHGMNIMVPRGKLKELRFELEIIRLDGNGIIVMDGFPTDEIHKKTRKFKVKFQLEKLLQFIYPIPIPAGGLAQFETEIKFSTTVSKKAFTEARTNKVAWFIKDEDLSEFEYFISIKKRKEIKKIEAWVEAIWTIEPEPESILDKAFSFFKIGRKTLAYTSGTQRVTLFSSDD